mmetsp:Transcript_18235/g.24023  ORF Transcript_18235/g.24023 Transcript_18235/m.24023 type:complete len:199 (-) Transcript_18235:261-857(-)
MNAHSHFFFMMIMPSLCCFAEITFHKDISVSLDRFRQMFVQTSNFYERYLESLDEHDISVSQWSKNRDLLSRKISFKHKMSSIPGIPSYVQTVKEQQYSYIPGKEIIIEEKSAFTGAPLVDAFVVETSWTIRPQLTGVKVTISSKIEFTEDSKLPSFVQKQIERKSFKEIEKSMSAWGSIVDTDVLQIQSAHNDFLLI